MSKKIRFVNSIPDRVTSSGRTPGTGRRFEFVAELKKRPGEWAVYELPNHATSSVRTSSASSMKKQFPGVEACVRGGVVYARWVGKNGGVK